MDVLKEKLMNYSAGRALDVGTGRGNFIPIISECFSNYTKITGIDSSEGALAAARESFKDDRIEFANMDASDMEFDDNTMDTVCISNTLHHLPDMYKVLNEMMRVLKPGGLFVISEMYCDNQNKKQLSHVSIHHFHAKIDTLLGICHDSTFTRQQIIDVANKLGLSIVDVFDYNTPEEQEAESYDEDEQAFLNNLFDSLEKRLEQVKGCTQYESLKAELSMIKDSVYEAGFLGATELMVLGRKMQV